MTFFRDFTSTAPDELTSFFVLGTAEGQGDPLAIILAVHSGPLEEGAKAVQPIKDFGPPVMDALGPIPYTTQQSMLDAGFPHGAQVYRKSTFLRELAPGAMDVLVQKAADLPTPHSALVVEHFHGAVHRVAADATAFNERSAAYNVAIVGMSPDPANNDRFTAWARSVYDDLQPWSTGSVYVNYLGVGDDPERVREAYGANYDRLAQIKQKYDPGNLFRANQNIRPNA